MAESNSISSRPSGASKPEANAAKGGAARGQASTSSSALRFPADSRHFSAAKANTTTEPAVADRGIADNALRYFAAGVRAVGETVKGFGPAISRLPLTDKIGFGLIGLAGIGFVGILAVPALATAPFTIGVGVVGTVGGYLLELTSGSPEP